MTIKLIGAAAALAIFAPAAQATTIVFDTIDTGTTTAATQTVTSGGINANFSGRRYTGTVANMNANGSNVATTATTVQRSATGLGVAGSGDGEGNQVDSNGINELLQVVFSQPGKYRIVSATIGKVDNTDTFALFGGNGGTYTRLGFTGALWDGIDGGIPVTTTRIGTGNAAERVYKLDFGYGGGFDSFRFGTNDEDADGYSFRSLTIAAVPEPSTWAMLILGFGMTGAALRRRAGSAKKARAALTFA